MKKTRSFLTKISTIAIVLMFVFTLASCKKKISVSIITDKDNIVYGEKIKLNTIVNGTDNTAIIWSISNPDIVTISYDNYLSVTQKLTSNEKVTITATSVADSKVTASKEFTVIAPKIEVSFDKSSLKVNESTNITVNVTGLLNKDYVLQLSDDSVVKLEGNVLTVTSDVNFPKTIVVTAVSTADNTISGVATIDVVPKEDAIVKMSISTSQDTIAKGETVQLSVEVTGSSDTGYTWSVSDPDLVKIENNTLTLIADVTLDKLVRVTATSTANPSVSVSKSIIVKAPYIEGQVGELTSAMLKEISNSSITVSGVLTDVYQDFNQSNNNVENNYDIEVKMSEGAWNGTWQISGKPSSKIVDCYRKGETDGIKNQNGDVGHALEKVYIGKNNTVEKVTVKDYRSIPAVWEAQHLWNHLDNLNITKFEYDAENEVYEYIADVDEFGQKTTEELYFLTYLSISLTPMLEDTIDKLYFVVNDGKITQLLAQTEVMYYGGESDESPDAMSYTTIRLSFSNIGTTVVEDPTPYEAPQYAEKLEAALETMRNAKNYTFQAVDTTTYAPSTDSGDYEIESTNSSSSKARSNPFVKPIVSNKVANYVSSVGTVGLFGQITEDAVLYATTGKYSYSMDGKNYHTEYTGLKQNSDGTYDEFGYSTANKALTGTKKVTGNIFDVLPSFDFSANVFKFVGSAFTNGITTYTFALRETSITRDIALEVSAYRNAFNAEASVETSLQIVVDENGNLVSTVYPYNITFGTYTGYITTTYSQFGTTSLPEDTFEGYVPRTIKTNWNEYTCKYYSPNFSSQTTREENAEVVLQSIFGDNWVDVPTPALFIDVFGDNVYGPFYDWKTVSTDSDGNEIYHGYMSITATSSNYDENSKILDFDELIEALGNALIAEGFTLSVGNTDLSGGKTGYGDYYVCYIKDDVQIVINNNHTRYFWIDFYITGDWILKRD